MDFFLEKFSIANLLVFQSFWTRKLFFYGGNIMKGLLTLKELSTDKIVDIIKYALELKEDNKQRRS